ncbi:hypothetical protein BDR22DRAFT_243056 [Usnea florida]
MSSSHISIMQSAAMARIWDFPKLRGRLRDIVENGLEMFPADLPVEQSHVEPATEERPEQVVIDSPGPTEQQTRKYKADLDSWHDQNSQASELIYAMCEDKPREYIEDDEFASNRWINLESHYQDSGFTLRFTNTSNSSIPQWRMATTVSRRTAPSPLSSTGSKEDGCSNRRMAFGSRPTGQCGGEVLPIRTSDHYLRRRYT